MHLYFFYKHLNTIIITIVQHLKMPTQSTKSAYFTVVDYWKKKAE